MIREFRKWDESLINNKTYYNQHIVEEMREKLIEYDNDIKQIERMNNQECKICTYIDDSFALQAFTDTYCGICGKKMTFPTSNTDKLCIDCARIHGLCKHCGGRID